MIQKFETEGTNKSGRREQNNSLSGLRNTEEKYISSQEKNP